MIDFLLPDGPLRVVCLGAHPDDIEIGCGATLLTLCAQRPVLLRALLLTGSPGRVSESRAALAEFAGDTGVALDCADLPDGRLPAHWDGAKQFLESARAGSPADLVFAPRLDDSHQDHALLAQLASTVWRDALTLRYEIPKWDGDLRAATTYVPVSAETARRKVELLDRHFGSQRDRDWWDAETFLGLMRLRGVECRARYAEGFDVGKAVLRLDAR